MKQRPFGRSASSRARLRAWSSPTKGAARPPVPAQQPSDKQKTHKTTAADDSDALYRTWICSYGLASAPPCASLLITSNLFGAVVSSYKLQLPSFSVVYTKLERNDRNVEGFDRSVKRRMPEATEQEEEDQSRRPHQATTELRLHGHSQWAKHQVGRTCGAPRSRCRATWRTTSWKT